MTITEASPLQPDTERHPAEELVLDLLLREPLLAEHLDAVHDPQGRSWTWARPDRLVCEEN